jgi:hypothetical protein
MGAEAQNTFAIASAFGELSARAIRQQNEFSTRAAQRNFNATKRQALAAADQESRELAGVFAKHIGTLRANSAARGAGGTTASSLVQGSLAEGARARANIDINAANLIAQAASQSEVMLQDPVLAQLTGTLEGLQFGSQFAAAVASQPPRRGTIRNMGSLGDSLSGGGFAGFDAFDTVGDLFPGIDDLFGD